jgi:segregation and condensation protein A
VIAEAEEEDEDPRASLIEKLLEYEKYKRAAEQIESTSRVDRDFFVASAQLNDSCNLTIELPDLDVKELAFALKNVLERAKRNEEHTVIRDELSTRDRMSSILNIVSSGAGQVNFEHFYDLSEGVPGIVVSFLAMLELVKERFITFTQVNECGVIYVSKTDVEGLDLKRLF